MTVAVRVDSSTAIGMGHLSRTLTLAEALRGLGERVVFVCRDLPGSSWRTAEEAGFECLVIDGGGVSAEPDATSHAAWLPGTRAEDADLTLNALGDAGIAPDWVLVDSYALDSAWERDVRAGTGCRIAVIDDLADREHDCDVLLDTGCREGLLSAYAALCPSGCVVLAGPRHAVLRREFVRASRDASLRRRAERALVFFGGSDVEDLTGVAMSALAPFAEQGRLEVDVVWGSAYAAAATLEQRFADVRGMRLLGPTGRMAELMAAADIALGAGGIATWERCFLGLPAVVTTLADNQSANVACVTRAGAAVEVPAAHKLEQAGWRDAVERLLDQPEAVSAMSEASRALVADAGSARTHSLVTSLMGDRRPSPFRLRPMTAEDLSRVLEWRNSEPVRARMNTRHEITAEEHAAWFGRLASDDSARAWVFGTETGPCGFFQLRGIDSATRRAEWGFYLAPEVLGRGLGSALLFLGAEAAFDEVGLDAIDAQVRPDNAASLRLHERMGFSAGGSLIAQEDATIMELTWESWDARRASVARAVYRQRCM